ncbi:MAG: AAA family ATPase, partial [Phycisphaerales bacterium]|nr:AAA family ATPase [Phycisphaerales bacterium]
MLDSARHDAHRLTALLRAGHPCIRIETSEESHARSIVDVAAVQVQHAYWIWSVTRGLRSGLLERTTPINETEHPAAALYHIAYNVTSPLVCLFEDLGPHLEDERTLRSLRDAIHACRLRGGSLILVDHTSRLPMIIAQSSTPFDLTLPDDEELEAIVKATLRPLHRERSVNISLNRTALRTLIRNLRGLTRDQAELFIRDAVVHDRELNAEDVAMVLAGKRRLLQRDGLMDFVECPADMKQIGGMRKLKRWLREREHAFDEDAVSYGIVPPRGLLLLGVQGAGKSLCAKAVASEWGLPLLRLDPSNLYQKYFGESERNLKRAIQTAESMAPVVLWLDEIEKALGQGDQDGGTSQRVFGTFLAWLQEKKESVFVIATANDISKLPPELLRKGR